MMKYKLALASLALGVMAFIPLWGVDKAVLALIFGVWAIREAKETVESAKYRRIAWAGVVLGVLYLITIIGVGLVYFPRMISLVNQIN